MKIPSGIVLIAAGIVLMVFAALSGSGGVALVFIFPVFYASGLTGAIGALLLFMGFLLLFFQPFYEIIRTASSGEGDPHYTLDEFNENLQQNRKTEFSGIVLIGPFPIIFSNDTKHINHLITMIILLMFMLFIIPLIFLILQFW